MVYVLFRSTGKDFQLVNTSLHKLFHYHKLKLLTRISTGLVTVGVNGAYCITAPQSKVHLRPRGGVYDVDGVMK
jgi:hypothetical protein